VEPAASEAGPGGSGTAGRGGVAGTSGAGEIGGAGGRNTDSGVADATIDGRGASGNAGSGPGGAGDGSSGSDSSACNCQLARTCPVPSALGIIIAAGLLTASTRRRKRTTRS
jgi:hypothetical protein